MFSPIQLDHGIITEECKDNAYQWLAIFVLLIVGISGTYGQQDLGNKVFLFPEETNTAHVILKPQLTTPLRMASVCLRSYTDLSRNYSLFSLALPEPKKSNAFLILSKPSSCSIYINGIAYNIKTEPDDLDWRHTCVTWDSATGIIQLWVNGKLYPRKEAKKGFTINTKISITLGQEQDSFGGGFDLNQCFVGELSDVHMWDYVLTPGDIQKVITNDKTGNIINWRSLHFEMKGNVLIQPKLQCKHLGYTSYTQC
ncbi:C-reactive protein-like [Leptodactylus fuscus]|uniref:C-reactive protein-like n=1 Tax=Leptodactylus fuscus TaxID=238119 RepID=UPI003F4EB807